MMGHPSSVHAAIDERRLDEFPVVESGVVFETVHVLPVLQWNCDEFGKREKKDAAELKDKMCAEPAKLDT